MTYGLNVRDLLVNDLSFDDALKQAVKTDTLRKVDRDIPRRTFKSPAIAQAAITENETPSGDDGSKESEAETTSAEVQATGKKKKRRGKKGTKTTTSGQVYGAHVETGITEGEGSKGELS